MTIKNEGSDRQAGGTELAGGQARMLSSKETAAYLGVSMRELKGLRKRRALPFFRIGHRTVSYSVPDLDAFLAKRRVAPEDEQTGGAAA